CRGENTRSKCPFKFDHNKHVFTSSTDNLGDMNLVRLRYDF
ncbi:hypothetical protein, partial [Klebsiella pneumoniae]